MAAVPPFLKPRRETHRKEGQHGDGGPGTGLEQLNRIGGATTGGKVGNKTTAHPTPTRLFAAPDETTAGPGKLIAIEQTAARANHPEAVLAARTGVHRAVSKEPINLRSQGISSGGGGHPSIGQTHTTLPTKSHPWGWRMTLSLERADDCGEAQ
jgi:hypothetical protein